MMIFRQSGFSITSVEFVGTVFLASLLAFLVLPYFQNSCLVQTVLVWFIAIWRSATTVMGIIGS